MSDIIRNGLYPGIPVSHPNFTGASTGGGITRFHFSIETGANEETAVDNAITAYPAFVQAQEAEAATEAANNAALADMIATFVVTPEAIEYFNALQTSLRNVSNNNAIVIGTAFPAMRTLLQTDAELYNRYLNLLRVSAGINQLTFEGSPTTAQQHNAFTIAQNFANAGMIQMIAGVLFG
jgi:hypothetical protein